MGISVVWLLIRSSSSPPFFQLQHGFSIWILFLYFGVHGRVIIFPALLFFICCTCYTCAFEGIPRQALYGSSVKTKAQEGLFLTHHGYISSSRENKAQPLRMTATDNRYYQTSNRRVGCKLKQHNVQSNREGTGAIKVLLIYIFMRSRQMVLASENLSSAKCQISLLSKVGCWHIISHPSI